MESMCWQWVGDTGETPDSESTRLLLTDEEHEEPGIEGQNLDDLNIFKTRVR